MIRAGRSDEIPVLREIELDAGVAFRDVGMARIADEEPPAPEALQARIDAGRLWVAVGPDDTAVAYLMADPVGAHAHIEQVSVRASAARRGTGARLIDRARRWGLDCGAADLTLCTFLDVPWNAPYYRRLGFAQLADHLLDAPLAAVRRREVDLGLDESPRTAMIRSLAEALR